MKIFLFTSVLSGGGAERVLCQLANAFSKEDDVFLLASYKTDNEYFIDDKIKKIYLDESIENKKSFQQILRLRKIIKKEKPDICIAFLPQPNLKMLLAAAGLNVKTIISVRNDPRREYSNFVTRMLAKTLYPMANGIVFQTKEAQKFFGKRIQNKSTVISNPVSSDFTVNKPYIGKREEKIVSVGRLTAQKNHKLLIDAFVEVHKKFNNHRLVIYGEGELRGELEAYVRKLNLNEFVKLPGKVNNIKSEIYKANCFVLSSDYEGMPNALMEAMALGVPCISTDCPCGGPRELIDDGENGFLVPVGDQKRIVQTIEHLCENRAVAKEVSNKAAETLRGRSVEIITGEWRNFLDTVR